MLTPKPTPLYTPPVRKAYVAFTTRTDYKWLQIVLGKSFPHCSLHIQDDKGWTSVEGLAGYTEIFRHDITAGFDLPDMLRKQGMIVVPAPLRRDEKVMKILAPSVFSCVELVKRILGLRQPFIITPKQLHRALVKINGGAA